MIRKVEKSYRSIQEVGDYVQIRLDPHRLIYPQVHTGGVFQLIRYCLVFWLCLHSGPDSLRSAPLERTLAYLLSWRSCTSTAQTHTRDSFGAEAVSMEGLCILEEASGTVVIGLRTTLPVAMLTATIPTPTIPCRLNANQLRLFADS
jgi:hypothetical protein